MDWGDGDTNLATERGLTRIHFSILWWIGVMETDPTDIEGVNEDYFSILWWIGVMET